MSSPQLRQLVGLIPGLADAGFGPACLRARCFPVGSRGGEGVGEALEVAFEAADDHGGIGGPPLAGGVGQLDVGRRDRESELVLDGRDGSGGSIETAERRDVDRGTGGLGVLDDLDDAIVFRPHEQDEPVRPTRVVVLIDDGRNADRLSSVIRSLIVTREPGSVTVSSGTQLETLRRTVAGDLSRASRNVALIGLAAGLAATFLSVAGLTAAQRTDFGRRRALGASRSRLVGEVMAHLSIAAFLGALVGCGVGLLTTILTAQPRPGPAVVLASVVLSVEAVVIGATPAVASAARRDPVRVLRTP